MVRFGILGTARIARLLFQRPLEGAQIAAVASREKSRAQDYAREFAIPSAYGSYDELLRDPTIHAVYIPLPQALHAKYAIRAAETGKHVLVEKPAALSVQEITAMVGTARRNRVLLMEGLMYRFLSVHKRVKQLVADGTIGGLRYIDFNWCVNAVALGRTGFRMDRRMGGGALYDLGIYGIDFMRYICEGSTPRLRSAHVYRRDRKSVDEFAHVVFSTDGVVVTITCAYNTDANYYTLSGEKGAVHVPRGVAGRPVDTMLQVHLLEGDMRFEEHFPAENSYILELEHFARCIEEGQEPLATGQNSLKNIRIMERVQANALQLRSST